MLAIRSVLLLAQNRLGSRADGKYNQPFGASSRPHALSALQCPVGVACSQAERGMDKQFGMGKGISAEVFWGG
jgi:hypothetical protein